MKYLILTLFMMFAFIQCNKDDQDHITQETPKVTYLDPEGFDMRAFMKEIQGRDGGQNSFMMEQTAVLYNPFTARHTQEAFNIRLLTRVEYFRVSIVNAYAWDRSWDIYNVNFIYADGSIVTRGRVYANAAFGNFHIHYPQVINNQVLPGNNQRFVKLERTTQREKYPDKDFGVIKNRLFYVHYFELDSIGLGAINSRTFGGTVYNFLFGV